LDCDPDLGEELAEAELAAARRRVIADTASYPRGRWAIDPERFGSVAGLGLLVIEGMLKREVTVADYTCAELLGPGDVLQPWLRIGPHQSVATDVDWEVVQGVRVAVLDREFLRRAAEWPEIIAAICRRVMVRTHWLAFHLAVCGLRRADERVLLVAWHFADRWGTVTPEGVLLDIPLTHDLLAAVTGARRPSVSVAVRRLVDDGLIVPRPRSRWLLLGRPPAELHELHEPGRDRP
jgi:hypothetical protein